jgi:hypothetical protein
VLLAASKEAEEAVSKDADGLSVAEKEEILRLKVCGHEFHAECLVSWCVVRKYSCPICRAVFYDRTKVEAEGEDGGESGVNGVEMQDADGIDGERRGI